MWVTPSATCTCGIGRQGGERICSRIPRGGRLWLWVDLQREVFLVDLHQLARQLQREARALIFEVVLHLVNPVGEVLLLVVGHVLVQILCFGLEARAARQIAQHRLDCAQDLAHLVAHLLGEHKVLDRARQVLADARAARLAFATASRRRARLEVVAQRLELLLELAEQRLARRRERLEDELALDKLLVAHQLAQ